MQQVEGRTLFNQTLHYFILFIQAKKMDDQSIHVNVILHLLTPPAAAD